jgi:hypothetical protein
LLILRNSRNTYNLRAVNPGLANQWHPLKNNDLRPEDVTPGSNKKVWWLCAIGRKTSRGIYKPVLCSRPLHVATIIDEKRISCEKGKIKERRKMTTYARYVYGLHRIPEGWVIWHIDGNSLNNNIENLECISRSELL